jgi:hypothetical protein
VPLVHRRLRIRLAAFAVVLAAVAAAAAPAGAATVQLDVGATTLQVDKRMTRTLRALGVSVAPLTPATTARGGGVALPITGGRVDPGTGEGDVEHAGGLQLRRGTARMRLTSVTVRAGSARRISAKAGGRRVDAFSIAVQKGTVRRRGFATTLADVPVKLTAEGATALNRALGVTAFRNGTRFGLATVRSLPAELLFDGGATTLALDPGFAATLQSLGIAAGPAAPASANPDGTIALPITRGRVNAKTLAGSVDHAGGLVFSRETTALTARDTILYTSGLGRLTADLGSGRLEVLALDVANAAERSAGLTETLSGIVARLTPDGATALNQAFGTTSFAAGQVLGAMTLTAHVA